MEYHCPRCKPRHKGRFFKTPDSTDLARLGEVEEAWYGLQPLFVPDDEIPGGDETDRLHRWGYIRYREMFNARQLLGLELNAGKACAEALRDLARRTEVEDLKSLVAVLIQTDRFGTGIADSLRVFSDSLRTKRRQRAEEFAAKMGVKMIPPLFLFILPATFVVVVGPAIVGIATGLLPWLKGGGQ